MHRLHIYFQIKHYKLLSKKLNDEIIRSYQIGFDQGALEGYR